MSVSSRESRDLFLVFFPLVMNFIILANINLQIVLFVHTAAVMHLASIIKSKTTTLVILASSETKGQFPKNTVY